MRGLRLTIYVQLHGVTHEQIASRVEWPRFTFNYLCTATCKLLLLCYSLCGIELWITEIRHIFTHDLSVTTLNV